MSIHKRYMAYRKGELYHYNKNHDPKNGQFTSGPGGSISAVAASRDPKFDDPDYHSYYQDDEVWAKAVGVIQDKTIPKLNGIDRDDPDIGDLTAMELADYFYSEYKNYVHDHPEEKGRVDDYAEYVKVNATKINKDLTVRDENNSDDDYDVITSTHKPVGRFEPPSGTSLSSRQFGASDNMSRRKEIVDSRDFTIEPGDSAALNKLFSKEDPYPKKKLFESEEAFNKRRRDIFDDRLAAGTMYTDTSSIKDKKQKTEIETRIFKEANGQLNNIGRYEGGAIRIALADRMTSCNSYYEAAVSGFSGLKSVNGLKTHNDVVDYVRKHVTGEYRKSISKVLKEMGYEDTKEGRAYVDKYVIEEVAELYWQKLKYED